MLTERKANLITRLADDKEFWTIIIYDSSVFLSDSEPLSVTWFGKDHDWHVTEQLTEKLIFVHVVLLGYKKLTYEVGLVEPYVCSKQV
jgi:hypothetical protein